MTQRNTQSILYTFIGCLIFLAPTNLFLTLGTQEAYTDGTFIDYLIPKIYLSVLISLTIGILYLFQTKRASFDKKKNVHNLLLIICLLFSSVFITQAGLTGIMHLFSLLFISFAGYIIIKSSFWKTAQAQLSLACTLFFQSSVGIYQHLTQQSVYGYLFFGETTLSHFSGIAKTTVNGVEKVLPYGTTAHPNLLAGFLVGYLYIYFRNNKLSLISGVVTIISLICLALTQSYSALLTGCLLCIYSFWLKPINLSKRVALAIIVSLFFISVAGIHFSSLLFVTPSLSRRELLQQFSLDLIKTTPLGIGITQFTKTIATLPSTYQTEIVRFIQPVHNVLLLWLTEAGIILGITTLYICVKLLNRHQLTLIVALTPLLFLDHYLLSLIPGWSLLIMLMSSETKELVKE